MSPNAMFKSRLATTKPRQPYAQDRFIPTPLTGKSGDEHRQFRQVLIENKALGGSQQDSSYHSLLTYDERLKNSKQDHHQDNVLAQIFFGKSHSELQNTKLINNTLSKTKAKPSPAPKKPQLTIAKLPYKVLDCPDTIDNFYCDLLGINSNFLFVALGQQLYSFSLQVPDKISTYLTPRAIYITAVAATEQNLYSGLETGKMTVFDIETQTTKNTLEASNTPYAQLVPQDNRLLSALNWNGHFQQFDLRAPQLKYNSTKISEQKLCGMSFNRQNLYAIGDNTNNITLLDKRRMNQPVHVLKGHQAAVKALSFSPIHSNILASGGGTADKTIKLWDCDSGQPLESLDAGAQVSSIQWSNRTPKHLISSHGFGDKDIMLWSVNSRKFQLEQTVKVEAYSDNDRPDPTENRVLSLKQSADGKQFFALNSNETLQFFHTKSTNKKPPAKPMLAEKWGFTIR